MMLSKCCTQYASKFGKLTSGHRMGKRSVFIPISKKGNAKECSNYHTIAVISHASKIMLKILQARLQQYLNHDYDKGFDCVDRNKLWKILKEMGIPDHLICLLRNIYAGQEATGRTGHGTDWFQIGKGVHQGCMLSPCLFNPYIQSIS